MKFQPTTFPLKHRYHPCVYAWFDSDNHCLYVGASTAGMCRFYDHHVIGKKRPVMEGDTLRVWICNSSIIFYVEGQLIQEFKPLYNKVKVAWTEMFQVYKPTYTINATEQPLCLHCHKPFEPYGRGKFTLYCSYECRNFNDERNFQMHMALADMSPTHTAEGLGMHLESDFNTL